MVNANKRPQMKFPISLIRCSNLKRLNFETLIQKCLTYSDFMEVVLVVPEMYSGFSIATGSSIKITFDKGVGIYEAMNLGLQTATQEFVFFVNDDDALVNNFVDVFSGAFSDNTQGLDLIEFRTQFFGGEAEHFKNVNALNRGQMPTSHQGQLWRKQKLIGLGGFKSKLEGFFHFRIKVAADLEMYLNALESTVNKKQHNEILVFTSHGGYSELNKNRRFLEVAAILSNRKRIPSIFFILFLVEFKIMDFCKILSSSVKK